MSSELKNKFNYKISLNISIILCVIAFGLSVFSGSSTIFDIKNANTVFVNFNDRSFFLVFIGISLLYISFLKFKKNEFKYSEMFFFFGGILILSPLSAYFSTGFSHNDVYPNNAGIKELFNFIVIGITVTLFQAFSYFIFDKLTKNIKEKSNG